MRLEIVDGLGRVQVVAATRVLVCCDDGTPIMVASELMPPAIVVSHAKDRDFARTLADLGVGRTAVVSDLVVGAR